MNKACTLSLMLLCCLALPTEALNSNDAVLSYDGRYASLSLPPVVEIADFCGFYNLDSFAGYECGWLNSDGNDWQKFELTDFSLLLRQSGNAVEIVGLPDDIVLRGEYDKWHGILTFPSQQAGDYTFCKEAYIDGLLDTTQAVTAYLQDGSIVFDGWTLCRDNWKYLSQVTATLTTKDGYTYSPDTETRIYLVDWDNNMGNSFYNEPVDMAEVASITYYTRNSNFDNSPMTTWAAPFIYDGDSVQVRIPGGLAAAVASIETIAEQPQLHVDGTIGLADVLSLAALPQLANLDLRDAIFAEPEHEVTFNSLSLVSVTLPSYVDGIKFKQGYTPNLAAMVWTNDSIAVPADICQHINLVNHNFLLYVNDASLAEGCGVANVVAAGRAKSIALDEQGNFYCPIPFDADTAVYTHKYLMETALDGDTKGWETLMLPFDVTQATHLGNGTHNPAKGAVKPFAAFGKDNHGGAKPFWLYAWEDGWQPADTILAYIPYLISMPNNSYYADEYNLSGTVEFKGLDVHFAETAPAVIEMPDYNFVGTTMKVAKNDAVAPINRNIAITEYDEGSAFVPGLRMAEPFEAYLTPAGRAQIPAPVPLTGIGHGTTLLPAASISSNGIETFSRDGILYINSSTPQTVAVRTLDGKTLQTVSLQQGTTTITTLTKGIYLINSQKVLVK